MSADYDVIVIGSGPAGLEAVKTATRHNLKCALIEKDRIGGLCFNRGCIPMKFYIQKLKDAKRFSWDLSLRELYEEKEEFIVSYTEKMVSSLKSMHIDVILDEAEILDENTVKFKRSSRRIKGKNLIVCTGSVPLNPFNTDEVYFPEDLFGLREAGQNILIVGAGASGLELATVFSLLRKRVVVVEKKEQVLPGIDPSVARRIAHFLDQRNITVKTGYTAKEEEFKDFDQVFVCVGRKPLNIAQEFKLYPESGVFLCGEARGKDFYAYTASYEARQAVEIILGKKTHESSYRNRVYSVFLELPLSWCRKDDDLAPDDAEVKIVPLASNPLSFCYNSNEGFIRAKIDKEKNTLREIYFFGEFSWEINHFLSLLVSFDIPLGDLDSFLFFHPSLSESIREILG